MKLGFGTCLKAYFLAFDFFAETFVFFSERAVAFLSSFSTSIRRRLLLLPLVFNPSASARLLMDFVSVVELLTLGAGVGAGVAAIACALTKTP